MQPKHLRMGDQGEGPDIVHIALVLPMFRCIVQTAGGEPEQQATSQEVLER